ncbi:MAG: hypothetical protein GY765_24345 [bacterium]|nr:hypothetical protein [bacterium]
MIRSLDSIPKNHKVFIYGTGSAGKSLYMWLHKCRPDVTVNGFLDSFKDGTCAGLPVYRLQEFQQEVSYADYDLILIASGANQQISLQLEKMGIHKHNSIVIPTYLMENILPSSRREKFLKTILNLTSRLFKGNLVLFFGEHGGKFIGNNKYYFLFLRKVISNPIYWVTDNTDTFQYLKGKGIPVLLFKEWPVFFIRYLFRANYFYFDNMTWQRKYPYLQHLGANIMHMSHGVGLKMTEKMMIPDEFMEKLTPIEEKRLNAKIFKNHMLVSTSKFYAENVSEPAYGTPMHRITLCGYPKNDLFYRDIPGSSIFIDTETLARVDSLKKDKHKIIIYAPTFRDMDSRFCFSDVIDYDALNTFLAANGLVLVIKGHTGAGTGGVGDSHSHIVEYANDRDGYPLLKRADLLVTDYSSIYMDFLHLRKPVVFFNYDYAEYIANHREIQFDYFKMTPGPKAANQEELERWLKHFLVDGRDGFKDERRSILELAFKHRHGDASARLYEEQKRR